MVIDQTTRNWLSSFKNKMGNKFKKTKNKWYPVRLLSVEIDITK